MAPAERADGHFLLVLAELAQQLGVDAERLWALTDAVLINRCFEDSDELIEVQAEQCRALAEQPEKLVGRPPHHWWVSDVAQWR